MKIKTHAFVLKTTIFKESSLIIRMFTREKGKSTYIVKAAMRQKSPNKAIYQQLNEVEIDYSHHPKKQIHPVYSVKLVDCLLYTSPSPRDATLSRMPSSA